MFSKVYAVVFRKKEAVTGLGKVRGRERASMSDHCILGAQSVAALKRQNGYFKEVIQMLIEEVSFIIKIPFSFYFCAHAEKFV